MNNRPGQYGSPAPGSYNYPPQQGYQHPPPQQGYPPQHGYPPQPHYPPQHLPPQQYAAPPVHHYHPHPPHHGHPPAVGYYAAVPVGPPVALGGVTFVKFFYYARSRYARDYTLIIDKSGSMAGPLWKQAEGAVAKIAPFACGADPDGISLYFFSSPSPRHPKYDNIRDGNMVMGLFARERPNGTTDLYGVLNQAINDHFAKGNKPETILVITDGIPNSESDVINLIVNTTKRISSPEDLSISFIQIGHDKAASKFLKKLDDDLKKKGARYDIVDCVTADEMRHLTFETLIDKSMYD
ncbi:hypothetical protein DICPUDRAFT_98865 [Dictyostelium purpureum]|uniref:VWFA domain-containing protein n=1 Tax=Dictyostelium purpureum TaxID=5786 RepID=F0ZU92_DICPU|nr:uncharacterized protein DICPUDRAFT_98865 [Dictyostelium purpureum]EGC32485.1 hypothetical protein DICPUDRAFT_98865 [Dictyostelium purpureum]|eukprot:XP_003290978.1 hypothetical protein DICPUDRAFT_98865 [Dictyostelium purpureum]